MIKKNDIISFIASDHAQKVFVFACCHEVGQLYIIYIYIYIYIYKIIQIVRAL